MLRALIAAVSVQRADVLAQLPNPAMTFGEQRLALRTEHYQRRSGRRGLSRPAFEIVAGKTPPTRRGSVESEFIR
jgi:hypothetical protein